MVIEEEEIPIQTTDQCTVKDVGYDISLVKRTYEYSCGLLTQLMILDYTTASAKKRAVEKSEVSFDKVILNFKRESKIVREIDRQTERERKREIARVRQREKERER